MTLRTAENYELLTSEQCDAQEGLISEQKVRLCTPLRAHLQAEAAAWPAGERRCVWGRKARERPQHTRDRFSSAFSFFNFIVQTSGFMSLRES
jgi:hypothetical protein